MVELDRMPSSCAVLTTSTQAAAGSLPLVSTHRTSSSRISAAVPGMVSRPASRSSVRKSLNGHVRLGRPGDDLHRGEGVHVQLRYPLLDRADQVGVGGRRQGRVDATLHADLGRAVGEGLLGPVGHLVQRQPERVGVALALSEGTEPATDVADVGEVDVPVHHVGDVVADRVPAKVVGQGHHRVQGRPPRPEQGQRIGLVDRFQQRGRDRRRPVSARPGCRRPASGRRRPRSAWRVRPPRPSRRRRCRSRSRRSLRPAGGVYCGIEIGPAGTEDWIWLLPRLSGRSRGLRRPAR